MGSVERTTASPPGKMAARRAGGAGAPTHATRPGLFGARTSFPNRVTLDKSCASIAAAHHRSVQTAMLEALRRSQTEQQRYPDGPPTVEYTLSGGPNFIGGGYTISPAYTDHLRSESYPSNHGLPRKRTNYLRGAWADNFVGHTHGDPNQDPNFSPSDLKSRLRGIDDIMIDAVGRLRCMPAMR